MSQDERTAKVTPNPWNIGFGITLFTLSFVALLVWFPLDIEGGFIETNQVGKREPGDAFFPILLASGILLLGAIQALSAFLWPGPDRAENQGDDEPGQITLGNLGFLAGFLALTAIGLAIMYYLGPAVVSLLNAFAGSDLTYRQLTDTVPYKYLGYAVGALVMTVPVIAWTEGGLTRRALIVVLLVVAVTILIYDGALINVQLPPNANY